MEKIKWLFLIYKIPNSPSSKRVFVWRKLKKLGVVTLQDAIFVLPYSEKNFEKFQWIAAKIIEMDGEATVWESNAATDPQEKGLVQKFNDSVNNQYSEIIEKLKKVKLTEDICEKEDLLKNILEEYTEIKHHDYFEACLGVKTAKMLTRKQKHLDELKYGELKN